MKSLSPKSSNRIIVAVLVLVALAAAFWILLLSPKREKVDALNKEVETQQASLSQAQSEVATGEAARSEFATDYQQLVVLGKAVPASDESASLFVQLNRVGKGAGVKFESLQVGAASESAPEAAPEEAAPEGEEAEGESEGEAEVEPAVGAPAAATESAASQLPLGATIGSAGLGVLPYDVSFKGNFFKVADFLDGMDSLIHTRNSKLTVDGRLVTIDGFVLMGDADHGFPRLNANFALTAYLVPPEEGITAGASPSAPAEPSQNPSLTGLR